MTNANTQPQYAAHEKIDGSGSQDCDLCGSETVVAAFEYEDMHWVSEDRQESQGTRTAFLCQLCGDNPKLRELYLESKSHGLTQMDLSERTILQQSAINNASMNLALNQINDMFLDHIT